MFSDLRRFVQTVCSSGYPPSDNHVWTTVGVVNERDNRCNLQLSFIAHTALTHASVNALLCKLLFECCTFKYSSSFSLQVVFYHRDWRSQVTCLSGTTYYQLYLLIHQSQNLFDTLFRTVVHFQEDMTRFDCK